MAQASSLYKDAAPPRADRRNQAAFGSPDAITALAAELLALVETHYERTGDPALREVVARGKRLLGR
jgi:hypothetical protein